MISLKKNIITINSKINSFLSLLLYCDNCLKAY